MATGPTLSTTSNLSSGQRIQIAAAREAYEPAAPDPDLVDNRKIGPGDKQFNILTYARLADATQLTEGNDLAQTEQLVAATVNMDPDEHGIIVTLSKKVIRRQADANVRALSGRQQGGSLKRREAKDIIALYGGFSKVSPGVASTLDITHFRGTIAYLMTDNDTAYGPAPMPVVAALHSEQISDIIVDLTDPGAVVSSRFGLSAEMLQRWWRGNDRLYGVGIFHSGNIARNSSDDADGAIFAKSAIIEVEETNVEATEQTDESARLVEMGLFKSWTESEIADPHGVTIRSDAASTL